jgi:predicted DNA binding protein
MPPVEIAFRVAYEGPLTDFARRHPAATISLWCDWKREVLEVAGADRASVDRLAGALSEHSSFTEVYAVGAATHVILMDCVGLPHDFVNEAVDRAHGLNIPPTRFENGWESYTIVSFTEAQARALFKEIRDSGRDVELIAKRPLMVQPLLNARSVGANALLAGLTDKQLDALVLAHRHGLYESPRRTTAAAIAEALGLSRSTFEEHVRKAENRLMANLVPYVELYAKARRSADAKAPEATIHGGG